MSENETDNNVLIEDEIPLSIGVPHVEIPDTYEVCIGSVRVYGPNLLKVAQAAVILAVYNRIDDMIDFDDKEAALKDLKDVLGFKLGI